MSSLLFDEQPLLIPKTLAKALGYHNAVFLQQLHYWLKKSNYEYDGKLWIYKTYLEWSEELALSDSTIKRIVKNLKKDGLILVENFNSLKIDKTNWYSINYELLYEKHSTFDRANRPSIVSTCHNGLGQVDTTNTIDYQYINNSRVSENDVVVQSVIMYLNEKGNKKFSLQNKDADKLIKYWLSQGFTFEDFKNVIDTKVDEWVNSKDMNKYIRPSTLFRKGKFENYVNQNLSKKIIDRNSESYDDQMFRLYGENWRSIVDEE
ncbi:conserved phage C-terminal domain-containing protein [Carnobacteriaceae bacterium zg-ZUI240]|nr:conserved phage C-terminal domain-containing protein [Carnobacteriaceae bacterium zg-ZUI240]